MNIAIHEIASGLVIILQIIYAVIRLEERMGNAMLKGVQMKSEDMILGILDAAKSDLASLKLQIETSSEIENTIKLIFEKNRTEHLIQILEWVLT